MGISDTEKVLNKFDELLRDMRSLKPNDRSEIDRYWAIAITETEKALGTFNTWVHEEYSKRGMVE